MRNLQKMTKGQLKEFAAKQGIELSMNDSKKVMIKKFNQAQADKSKTVIKGEPVTNEVTQPVEKKSFWQLFKEFWGL